MEYGDGVHGEVGCDGRARGAYKGLVMGLKVGCRRFDESGACGYSLMVDRCL